jgi:hypothetical protein
VIVGLAAEPLLRIARATDETRVIEVMIGLGLSGAHKGLVSQSNKRMKPATATATRYPPTANDTRLMETAKTRRRIRVLCELLNDVKKLDG